jgi:hypothetical protein
VRLFHPDPGIVTYSWNGVTYARDALSGAFDMPDAAEAELLRHGFSRTEPVSGDLTTVSKLRQWISLKPGTDDGQLARLVSAVSLALAGYCNRIFKLQGYSEVRNGTGGTVLVLRQIPVMTVGGLWIDGRAIAAKALPDVSTVAILDAGAADLATDGTPVSPATPVVSGAGWVLMDERSLQLDGFRFTKGVGNVVVRYTAGYAPGAIPGDLEQACIDCCASWYKRRERIDQQSIAAEGQVLTFSLADLPSTARLILDQKYRRVVAP